MNTSADNLQPGQQPTSSGNKPLWAAVGVLSLAVLGMGGAMIYNQRPQPPAAMVAAIAPAPLPSPTSVSGSTAPTASANSANVADDLIEKPAAAPAKPAPVPAKKVVKPVPKPAPAPGYAGMSPAPSPYPVPAAVVAAPVCGVCGSVDSVTPVERSSKPAGVGIGTVAGGVLGAVLGNQVGSGNGRTAATILGAVGGGFAGNAIEGRMRKETVYEVGVRMEDGSHRVVELGRAPNV
ncbi:MAG: glycine zipper 2TM domain-containing protein, partial [Polaromonas sp.]